MLTSIIKDMRQHYHLLRKVLRWDKLWDVTDPSSQQSESFPAEFIVSETEKYQSLMKLFKIEELGQAMESQFNVLMNCSLARENFYQFLTQLDTKDGYYSVVRAGYDEISDSDLVVDLAQTFEDIVKSAYEYTANDDGSVARNNLASLQLIDMYYVQEDTLSLSQLYIDYVAALSAASLGIKQVVLSVDAFQNRIKKDDETIGMQLEIFALQVRNAYENIIGLTGVCRQLEALIKDAEFEESTIVSAAPVHLQNDPPSAVSGIVAVC